MKGLRARKKQKTNSKNEIWKGGMIKIGDHDISIIGIHYRCHRGMLRNIVLEDNKQTNPSNQPSANLRKWKTFPKKIYLGEDV